MPESPVFIVGTERSGSNLLRLMLNAHPRIAVPHPPHILHYFTPLEPTYGDLAREENLRRLVTDVLRLVRAHIDPWELEIDPEAVVREARPRDLIGVFAACYEQYRTWSGKARWGCKSTFLIEHTARIRRRFPAARLIWLVRDPRDVAASSRRSVFSPCHPWLTAELWRRQQELGLELERELPAEMLLRLGYEELLADPAGQVERLCGFLGEPFEEAMLRFFETPEARRSGALSESWRLTARPIQSGNTGRFRRELSAGEIRLVESVAGEPMRRLGYLPELAPEPDPPPSPLERLGYHLWDRLWRLRVEWRSLRRDRNHWRRWRRGWTVRTIALRRRLAAALGGGRR